MELCRIFPRDDGPLSDRPSERHTTGGPNAFPLAFPVPPPGERTDADAERDGPVDRRARRLRRPAKLRSPTGLERGPDDEKFVPHGRPAPGPTAGDDADPVSGREWTTGGTDLQFACTFALYERASSGSPVPVRRACSSTDRKNSACDCDGTKDTPLCAPDDRNVQIKGKAYPTRRELMVAKELDSQGIVASLCPQQLTKPDEDDYGYRPAVRAITSRLERQLVGSCVPRALERQDAEGNVACLVLAMLPNPGPDSDCARFGLEAPNADLLAQTRDRLRAEEGEEATRHPICEIPQVPVPRGEVCKDASDAIGFCCAEAPLITHCAHAIAFTKASEQLTAARFTMQSIQQTSN